jgi:hypothetical protein
MSLSKLIATVVGGIGSGKTSLCSALTGIVPFTAQNSPFNKETFPGNHRIRFAALTQRNSKTLETFYNVYFPLHFNEETGFFNIDSDTCNSVKENGQGTYQNEDIIVFFCTKAIENPKVKVIVISRCFFTPDTRTKLAELATVLNFGVDATQDVRRKGIELREQNENVPDSTLTDVATFERVEGFVGPVYDFTQTPTILLSDKLPLVDGRPLLSELVQLAVGFIDHALNGDDLSAFYAKAPEVVVQEDKVCAVEVRDEDPDSDSEEGKAILAWRPIPSYNKEFFFPDLTGSDVDFSTVSTLRAERKGILISDLKNLPKGKRLMWMAKIFAPDTMKLLRREYSNAFVNKADFEFHAGTNTKPTKEDMKLLGTKEQITLTGVYGDSYCHGFLTSNDEHATIAYFDGKIQKKDFDAIPDELRQSVFKHWNDKPVAAYYAATALELAKANAPETFISMAKNPQTINVMWCGVYYP